MKIDGAFDRPDVGQLLAQMRAMKQTAAARVEPDVSITPAAATNGTPAVSPLANFESHLVSALRGVASAQGEASRMTDSFVRGQQNDLVATMVATQKSSVAFQAAVQVRNRLVTAYETIMNMPI